MAAQQLREQSMQRLVERATAASVAAAAAAAPSRRRRRGAGEEAMRDPNDDTAASLAPPQGDAANHPAVVSSFDMGTSNFAYFIGQPRAEEARDVPRGAFAALLKPLRWIKTPLAGATVPEWDASVMAVLDAEPLLVHSRSRRVYIEQQVAPDNPVMYAIASGVHMYFLMRKNLHVREFPEEIATVNAHLKFSYFLLKTPDGRANRPQRKRLARLIVEYLLERWVGAGKVAPGWLALYRRNKAKQDDYADSFLQCYAEECKLEGVEPSWEALQDLWSYLMRDASFGGENAAWPLALTAEGERKYQSYVNRLDREQARAEKERAKADLRAAKERAKQERRAEKEAEAEAAAAARNGSSRARKRQRTSRTHADAAERRDEAGFASPPPPLSLPTPPGGLPRRTGSGDTFVSGLSPDDDGGKEEAECSDDPQRNDALPAVVPGLLASLRGSSRALRDIRRQRDDDDHGREEEQEENDGGGSPRRSSVAAECSERAPRGQKRRKHERAERADRRSDADYIDSLLAFDAMSDVDGYHELALLGDDGIIDLTGDRVSASGDGKSRSLIEREALTIVRRDRERTIRRKRKKEEEEEGEDISGVMAIADGAITHTIDLIDDEMLSRIQTPPASPSL